MKQIELTSKLVLAIIGLASVGAILIPTYAVPTIRSGDIFDGEVKTADLANGAVTNPKLANDAVTSLKIKNGEVKAEDLAAGAVVPNVEIVREDFPIEAGGFRNGDATCPDGYVVTGGGVDKPFDVEIGINSPGGDVSWVVGAHNPGNTDVNIAVYAICLGPSP